MLFVLFLFQGVFPMTNFAYFGRYIWAWLLLVMIEISLNAFCPNGKIITFSEKVFFLKNLERILLRTYMENAVINEGNRQIAEVQRHIQNLSTINYFRKKLNLSCLTGF